MAKTGFLNALGTTIYIAMVATLLQNGEKIFGSMNNFVGPIAFLLLFALSAIIVGGLILGRPLTMYLDGKKKEAVSLFLVTAAWLAGFTVLALVATHFVK